jgi:hypothetical protein
VIDYRKTYTVKIEDEQGEGKEYAIRTELSKDGKKDVVRYFNFEREHTIFGRVKKQLLNGLIIQSSEMKSRFTFTELTMEEFEAEIRPRLTPEVSEMLNDLDDVYTWCRHQAGIN